ncbi:hypothetical protein GmHk_18G052611 [Glycine max]|nr:hypothetical protein GmHk_18G052611 [Glycine max]
MHSIIYNQDLVSPTLLAGWTKLREFYGLTGNHQVTSTHYGQITFKVILTEYKVTCNSLDVSSTMYSFMKAARFTYLNLEGTECKIVYNHHRKTAKIGNGWRTFAQT